MLLAVDIGNSNTKLAVFDGDTIAAKLSLPTVPDATSEGLAKVLTDRITGPITRALISSVVPALNSEMADAIHSAFGAEARVIENAEITGLDIVYQPVEAAGTDRLLNSLAAAELYGTPVTVCSFGTAFTIDHITAERKLIGGSISPGLRILSRALHINTARLPEVEVSEVSALIQADTDSQLRSGIFYGFVGQVDGLLARLEAELGYRCRTVATGGDAAMVAAHTDRIDDIDTSLLLKGIKLIADREVNSQ